MSELIGFTRTLTSQNHLQDFQPGREVQSIMLISTYVQIKHLSINSTEQFSPNFLSRSMKYPQIF